MGGKGLRRVQDLSPVARVPVLVGALLIGQYITIVMGEKIIIVARKIATGRLHGCMLVVPCEV